jgi:hypothetical protein
VRVRYCSTVVHYSVLYSSVTYIENEFWNDFSLPADLLHAVSL